jgi:hypothetical protein
MAQTGDILEAQEFICFVPFYPEELGSGWD